LTKIPGKQLVFDPKYEPTDERVFEGSARGSDELTAFYPDAVVSMPRRMQEPLGNPVIINVMLM